MTTTDYTLATVPDDAILTRDAAARLLDISRSTLLRRVAAGDITAMPDGRILGAAIVRHCGPVLQQVRVGTVHRQRTSGDVSLRQLAKSKGR